MKKPENSKTQNQIFEVGRLKNPNIKHFFFWFLLFFLMKGIMIWFEYRQYEDIRRMLHEVENTAIYLMLIVCFIVYAASRRGKNLPKRFEINRDGITQVDKHENNLFIAWDEIDKVARVSAVRGLMIEASSVKKRMIVPNETTDFQLLSERILAEYRARRGKPDPYGRISLPSSSKKRQLWFMTCLLWILAVGGSISWLELCLSPGSTTEFDPMKVIVVVVLGFVVVGKMSVDMTRKAIEVSRNQLMLNDLGITRIDQIGNQTMVRWNEIGNLNDGTLAEGVVIEKIGTKERIYVSEAYEGYTDIRERVEDEYMRWLKSPSFPASFGRLVILGPAVALSIFFSFVIGSVGCHFFTRTHPFRGTAFLVLCW